MSLMQVEVIHHMSSQLDERVTPARPRLVHVVAQQTTHLRRLGNWHNAVGIRVTIKYVRVVRTIAHPVHDTAA